ncbi:MAG TPA: PQQ-binding-like beta-propeller repeat protein [Candidatus Thermoplasmatota archaeon]|nr:PQQ-binding-like beta-propeller repeat protein [Candidatus Thermoplasmatota archaeon]
MKKQFLCILVSLLLVSTVPPIIGAQSTVPQLAKSPQSSVVRGDTTTWPMIRHDSAHTGASTTKAPSTCTLLWNSSVAFSNHSSPLEDNDHVYVSSSNGIFTCLDAHTGHLVWVTPPFNTSTPDTAGISNSQVYITADKLYCLNAVNGKSQWNQTLGGNGRAPTLADNKVFIGARQVYCFNAANGSLLWNFSLGNTSLFSSPAVTDDTVFVGDSSNAQLCCLNASTGALKWNVSLSQYGTTSATLLIDGGYVYTYAAPSKLLCFNAMNGSCTWTKSLGVQILSSLAISAGRLYFGCNNTYVYCVDALTGTVLWGSPTGGSVASSPAVADSKVYVSSDKFYCLDAFTGTQLWAYPTAGGVSSPAIANGQVYVCDNNQRVFCFTASYAPDVPATPAGPQHAGFGISLNYSTVSRDFEGDQIYYLWDWGDGNQTDWIGPFASDVPVTKNYSWAGNGSYDVRVKAKDTNNHVSSWSQPLTVTIAPQISLETYKVGFIYFRFFMFNNSYFYSQLLQALGLAVVLSNRDLVVSANASPAVHSVVLTAFSPTANISYSIKDDNRSDGFSGTFYIMRDLYAIILDAYDANGTFIDHSVFTLLFYWRFGSPANASLQQTLRGHTNPVLHQRFFPVFSHVIIAKARMDMIEKIRSLRGSR